MITKKTLLSENVKDFMDYALEVIKSMDGAPEHSAEEQAQVRTKIAELKIYLDHVAASYDETTPNGNSNLPDEAKNNFSGTGHS